MRAFYDFVVIFGFSCRFDGDFGLLLVLKIAVRALEGQGEILFFLNQSGRCILLGQRYQVVFSDFGHK